MKHPYRVKTKRHRLLSIIENIIYHSSHNQHTATTTTLLICSTRECFLDRLKGAIVKDSQQRHRSRVSRSSRENSIRQNEDEEDNDDDDFMDEDEQETQSRLHPLLVPTLHLLSTSQTIKLVFLPSIPVFRAFISVYSNPSPTTTTNDESATKSKITVINFLSLHHRTSEFSLQGLSRSTASLVSAASRTNSELTLFECEDYSSHLVEEHDGDDDDDDDRGRITAPNGPEIWNAQVPLLSGSVKLAGVGAMWAGRSIVAKRVMERWFELDDEEEEDSRE